MLLVYTNSLGKENPNLLTSIYKKVSANCVKKKS